MSQAVEDVVIEDVVIEAGGKRYRLATPTLYDMADVADVRGEPAEIAAGLGRLDAPHRAARVAETLYRMQRGRPVPDNPADQQALTVAVAMQRYVELALLRGNPAAEPDKVRAVVRALAARDLYRATVVVCRAMAAELPRLQAMVATRDRLNRVIAAALD